MKRDKLILIVEDDADISSMMVEMLRRKGFSSMVLSTGEVNPILLDNSIDLVILDIPFPGIRGTEICKKLKKSETTSQIPVVIMSAYPNAEEFIKEAGADDFIAKPFEMKDLFSHINDLLIETHIN